MVYLLPPSQPKIDYLQDTLVGIYQNIRWLQITMYHTLLMDVLAPRA